MSDKHPAIAALEEWNKRNRVHMAVRTESVFLGGFAAGCEHLLPLLRDCLGAIEEGRDDLIDRIERELGREG